MTIIDLIVLILAADAVITAWFYGTLFENMRTKLENKSGLFGELLGCPLCLSYHICFWLSLLLILVNSCSSPELVNFFKFPFYGLAATDIVHFLQQIRPFEGISEEGESSD